MADKKIVAVFVISDEDNSGPELETFLKSAPDSVRYTLHEILEEDFLIDYNAHKLILSTAIGGKS